MSTNLLIALVLLPALGALIAWAGDVIGYRLGKTRRSLFGLRPRTTARLVGIAVGAGLPLAGLLFAMAVSQDARDAILHIRDLQQRAVELTNQNEALRQANERTLREARQADERANVANTRRAAATARLQRTEGELAGSRARLDQARSALDRANISLSATRVDLSAARASLAQAREQVSKAKSGLAQAKANLTQARQDLTRTEANLAGSQKKLESMNAYVAQLATLERRVKEIEQYQAEMEEKLAARQQLLEDYGRRLDAYKIRYRAIVTGDVAFEPGEEIIRSFVESGRSQEQLEAILGELLSLASTAAARKGIPIGPNGRAVLVVSPMPPSLAPREVTEAAIISDVAGQIRQGGAPVYVVIVRAWGRTYRQAPEQMPVEFWVAPNRVVFDKGEVLLSRQIDGRRPRAYVFSALWQMLGAVRQVTAQRGVLPDPETGHYVEVPAEEILDALDQVLQTGGEAVVSAMAAEETRVAQPKDKPTFVHLKVAKAAP